MISFDQWLNRKLPEQKPERELPEGIFEMKPGSGFPRYMAYCCRCDELTELYCDPSEVDDDYQHYCGGSPRCMP